jgi:hypothetical protein
LNHNSFYDIGEGRSGVRVDVDNSAFYALSTTSGGYAVPVSADGTYNVSFTGGGFATFATTATVTGGLNVKVDDLVTAALTLLGDYNQNGVVDSADYVIWRKNFGSATALPNDDTAGVGNDDYTRWRTRFGNTLAGSGAGVAIPEPGSVSILMIAVGIAMTVNRRRDVI